MKKENDGNDDIQLQMTTEEFQVAVQNAVENAILDIFVFVLGLVLTFIFVISGGRMIISTPGIGWDIFGILNISLGLFIFWWAVLK